MWFGPTNIKVSKDGVEIMDVEIVFLRFVVTQLVDYPDDITIDKTIDERGVLLELGVNPRDVGRVIGKQGVTAQAIRTLLRALGMRNEARYNLKIMDPRKEDQNVALAFGEAE